MTETTNPSTLIEVLRGGRQCDEDGSEIIMSRQACCEAADLLEAIASTSTQPASAVQPPLKYYQPAAEEAVELVKALGYEYEKNSAGLLQWKPSAVVQEPAAEIVADEHGYLTTQWAVHYIPNKGDKLYTHPQKVGAVEPTAQQLWDIIAAVPDIGDKAAREFTIARMSARATPPPPVTKVEPTPQPAAEVKTGWPPGMMQDDSKGLSKWLSNTPNAKQDARDAAAPQPVAGDVGEALRQAEHGLSLLVKFQSSGKNPSIHDYGVARRALDVVVAAMSPSKQEGV